MNEKRRIRAVAVLPTLFTLGNLLCGFFAIVVAARVHKPDLSDPALGYGSADVANCALAAVLIFLAMAFDALDGHLARLSKTATNFGAQLDSLADLVTFGVAPAFLLVKMCPAVTAWNRYTVWIIAAAVATCAAMRLARFNVESGEDDDHMSFIGLPSPAGGGTIASFAFMFWALRSEDATLPYASQISYAAEWALPIFAVGIAMLMVSRIPYPHVVNQFLQGDHSFKHVTVIVFAFALVMTVSWYSVPALLSAFVLASPLRLAWQRVMHRDEETSEEPLF